MSTTHLPHEAWHLLADTTWKRWQLPPVVQETLALLLNQQGWCWGQDIHHPNGNALITYGGTRQRYETDSHASSVYVFEQPDKRQIWLWGFGVWYGDAANGVYLPRCDGEVRVTALLPLCTASSSADIGTCNQALSQHQCREAYQRAGALCTWIGAYETWIMTRYGSAYRQRVVAEWGAWMQEWTRLPADDMPTLWQRLATVFTRQAARR